MAQIRTRFSRKLHDAKGDMLLITLCLAWYFLDSVKWYQYDVQRIAMANNVLQAYQEVAKLTFRELNDLGEAVDRGQPVGGDTAEQSREALRLADAFRARVVDATNDSFVFELTGKTRKVDQFLTLMQPLGLTEVVRTGIAAIRRGPEAMKV